MKTILTKSTYLSLLLLLLIPAALFTACNDDDDDGGVTIIPSWTVALSAKYQNPGLTSRPETGTLNLTLADSITLEYTITVNNLTAGDVLTLAHLHAGDALTNGPVILDFNPVFINNTATGTLSVTEAFIDSLKNTSNEIYFNVHSQQYPNGLIRGQLNTTILLAADLELTGANQVPAVTTTATGTAALRLTSANKLYSKITVTNLESADALTMAHIHLGGVGVNGDVIVPLCESADDFGINKIFSLDGATVTSLRDSSTYVNVHTTLFPNGLIRGQLGTAIPGGPGPGPDPY